MRVVDIQGGGGGVNNAISKGANYMEPSKIHGGIRESSKMLQFYPGGIPELYPAGLLGRGGVFEKED